jgi:hypothetical protein
VFTRALGADDLALIRSAVWISLDELDLMKEALRRHQRAIKGPSRGHQGSSRGHRGSSKGHQGFINGSLGVIRGLMICLSQTKMKKRPRSPSRWHSKALRGTQMALNDTQRHSMALEALNSNHLALADQDEGDARVALPKEEITLAEVDRLEGVEHRLSLG